MTAFLSLTSWDDLRFFLAVHRHGALASAARGLNVDATTVARRLARLEDGVGTPLFAKTSDGFVLTPAGAGIVEHVERIEHYATLTERALLGDSARLEGSVRIATTDEFSSHFLLDHLGAFRREHPRIDLELVSGQALIDVSRGDADVAIRFSEMGGRVPVPVGHEDVRAQRVGTVGICVYGSKAYFQRAGRPASASDVRGHDIVAPRESVPFFPGTVWTESVRGWNRIALRTDGLAAMTAAAAAGFGLCALPAFLALRHPELEPVGVDDIVDNREIWILMPAEVRRVARVRAVRDFLVELLEHWAPLLTGRSTRPYVGQPA